MQQPHADSLQFGDTGLAKHNVTMACHQNGFVVTLDINARYLKTITNILESN